jgi:hypothetical protein
MSIFIKLRQRSKCVLLKIYSPQGAKERIKQDGQDEQDICLLISRFE